MYKNTQNRLVIWQSLIFGSIFVFAFLYISLVSQPTISSWDYEGFSFLFNGLFISGIISLVFGLISLFKSDVAQQYPKMMESMWWLSNLFLIGSLFLSLSGPDLLSRMKNDSFDKKGSISFYELSIGEDVLVRKFGLK